MNIEEKLSQKATEAFIMAIELYNKPTIKYRIEGFSFFICNAWELLLKAKIELKFNRAHFNLFCKYFRIKENPKFCYISKIFSQPQYSYSLQTIDFIVAEIKKDPQNIIEELKAKIKSQPQGQRNSNQE